MNPLLKKLALYFTSSERLVLLFHRLHRSLGGGNLFSTVWALAVAGRHRLAQGLLALLNNRWRAEGGGLALHF